MPSVWFCLELDGGDVLPARNGEGGLGRAWSERRRIVRRNNIHRRRRRDWPFVCQWLSLCVQHALTLQQQQAAGSSSFKRRTTLARSQIPHSGGGGGKQCREREKAIRAGESRNVLQLVPCACAHQVGPTKRGKEDSFRGPTPAVCFCRTRPAERRRLCCCCRRRCCYRTQRQHTVAAANQCKCSAEECLRRILAPIYFLNHLAPKLANFSSTDLWGQLINFGCTFEIVIKCFKG